MVKVRLLLFTVTSGLLELIATVTSAVGAAFSLTPYVPTPASPTVNDAGVKVMPGLSSSSTVTLTDAVTPLVLAARGRVGDGHGLIGRVAVIDALDGDRLLPSPSSTR